MGPAGGRLTLSETNIVKDLGVYTPNDLKPAVQCERAAAEAMRVVWMIQRYFEDLDVSGFRRVYQTHVRPHLDYAVQVWSLYFVKDIECLKRVQRRATKLVKCLKNTSYEERYEHWD